MVGEIVRTGDLAIARTGLVETVAIVFILCLPFCLVPNRMIMMFHHVGRAWVETAY